MLHVTVSCFVMKTITPRLLVINLSVFGFLLHVPDSHLIPNNNWENFSGSKNPKEVLFIFITIKSYISSEDKKVVPATEHSKVLLNFQINETFGPTWTSISFFPLRNWFSFRSMIFKIEDFCPVCILRNMKCIIHRFGHRKIIITSKSQ